MQNIIKISAMERLIFQHFNVEIIKSLDNTQKTTLSINQT